MKRSLFSPGRTPFADEFMGPKGKSKWRYTVLFRRAASNSHYELFAAPYSPTVKGNASGGRGAAPDPAGGNDFPRTPSVWVPAARINKAQRSATQSPGPGTKLGPARPWRVWAEPTCDQIGFDKLELLPQILAAENEKSSLPKHSPSMT
ncbi:MAG: hypothetical protein LBH65_06165 [Desulfovibrio sp.]|jgi:hypothetical protein|nr:hypothetical protein [Desulfovibrio sp.]